MATPGYNEGFGVLEEFVCEAKPNVDLPVPASKGRGVHPGKDVVKQWVVQNTPDPLADSRIAELRAKSNVDLLALLRFFGSDLNRQELLLIHEIAAERLMKQDNSLSAGSIELVREAMLVALNRTAS